jgi:predicted acyl esterase
VSRGFDVVTGVLALRGEAGRRPGSAADGRIRGCARLLPPVAAIAFMGCASPAPAPQTTQFSARGSAGQVYVVPAPGAHLSRAKMTLLDRHGRPVETESADSLGGLLFRHVQAGSGYKVRLDSNGKESGPVIVHSDAATPWDHGIYDQSIPTSGYTYLTTRDGTRLAIDVHPPTQPAGLPLPLSLLPPHGPFPTLIEYSGYGYADPEGPENGLAALANLMGFAVVDVNMRGTGCSGGAYDYFEPLQSLDAYDVIETVARQPWVLGHKVGMFGISYGGISQLFAARLNPPDLAAIAPLSVLDATLTTLYPGGIRNTGFAEHWAQERQADAEPAGPGAHQKWAYEQIQQGDRTCNANQTLHGEATNVASIIHANAHYVPSVADPLDPTTFVHEIRAPTFLVCQWEDEQTGGHCPALAANFTGTRRKWFTFTNGAHIDSIDPATLNRLYDFLELFVAHRAPSNGRLLASTAPIVYYKALGTPLLNLTFDPLDVKVEVDPLTLTAQVDPFNLAVDPITLPHDPIQSLSTYKSALNAFEALPEVRVPFDNGAGKSDLGFGASGDPYPTFEQSFASFPIPGTRARIWYLGPGGTLRDRAPTAAGEDSYTSDPSKLRAKEYTDWSSNAGGDLWGNAEQWHWEWRQNPPGSFVSYVSPPLAASTVVIGGGSVHMWVRSSTPDVDLQATVSEVRPDGYETFVQNGWLRASERKLSTTTDDPLHRRSTLLEPVPSDLPGDVAPMPAHSYAELSIPLYYEGHAYRAGSRIRVTISPPNGTQPVWSFAETQPATGSANVSVAFSPNMPSSLILPVVPGVRVRSALPPCPSLRNEPCRKAG